MHKNLQIHTSQPRSFSPQYTVKMTSLRAKILQTFKNLKSDAVPRAPRPEDENVEAKTPESPITEEPMTENIKNEKKKNSFFPHSKKKKKESLGNDNDPGKTPTDCIVNTQDDSGQQEPHLLLTSNTQAHTHTTPLQHTPPPSPPAATLAVCTARTLHRSASGNVINIVNSRDFHWGNDYVYYVGMPNKRAKDKGVDDFDDELIEKDNLIMLLMEATTQPNHPYIDYISKNLGKNWHSFFRTLGFTKGRIETMEIDEARNGVSEARYKLLLDWIRNDDEGTLGKLATLLWQDGERQIVKDLALMYKNRKET